METFLCSIITKILIISLFIKEGSKCFFFLSAVGLHIFLLLQESGSSSVPVHRTLNQEQPLVFPSSFDATDTQVRPVEPLNHFGPHIPYGPRALHVGADGLPIQKKRKKRRADILSRTERSADIGVQSGYEVVSEVDLDFIPDAVDRKVATFQVIVIYLFRIGKVLMIFCIHIIRNKRIVLDKIAYRLYLYF